MQQERKKDIKKLLYKFNRETMFMSSTHMMYDNKRFLKLEKIISKTSNKKRLFKIIKSQLSNNVFVYRLLQQITGQQTNIKKEDWGKMNLIFDFWNEYEYEINE